MQGDFSRWTFDPAAATGRCCCSRAGCCSTPTGTSRPRSPPTTTRSAPATSSGAAAARRHDRGPGPFAVVGRQRPGHAVGLRGRAWAALRVTAGPYYVDGVLVESRSTRRRPGWPLGDQPLPAGHRRTGAVDPALPEPDGRRPLRGLPRRLARTRHRRRGRRRCCESALGGPDTTTRAQTVWQVRLAPSRRRLRVLRPARPGTALTDAAGTMAAALADRPTADADPCQITAAGGYQRLENQLYRVQVHDGGRHRVGRGRSCGRGRTAASSPAWSASARPTTPE